MTCRKVQRQRKGAAHHNEVDRGPHCSTKNVMAFNPASQNPCQQQAGMHRYRSPPAHSAGMTDTACISCNMLLTCLLRHHRSSTALSTPHCLMTNCHKQCHSQPHPAVQGIQPCPHLWLVPQATTDLVKFAQLIHSWWSPLPAAGSAAPGPGAVAPPAPVSAALLPSSKERTTNTAPAARAIPAMYSQGQL